MPLVRCLAVSTILTQQAHNIKLTMAEPYNRPLINLPLLVITGIAEALCSHCTDHSKFSSWQTSIHRGSEDGRALVSNMKALAKLATTCKDLHAIVTPILYHQVQCDPEHCFSLLRTLAGRPDLARRVKFLRLDFDYGWAEPKDKDEETFVLELAARHGWMPTSRTGVETEDGHDQDEQAERKRAGEDLPMNLMMALCPNLEHFSAVLGYFYAFDLLQPAALPHLKDVYIAHRDTEGGTHLAALEELYLAAPSIETFTSHMTEGVGTTILPLGNVRHVCLSWSAISPGCLRTLLKSCPQLESFEYGAGGPCVGFEQFSVPKMVKLLSHYVPWLKHLNLDIQGDPHFFHDSDDEEEDDERDFEPTPGFTSLSHLETLVVEAEVVNMWEGQQPAATLFPQSLRSLTVVSSHLPMLRGTDLKVFASTARNFLPNLSSVASLSGWERVEYLPDPAIP